MLRLCRPVSSEQAAAQSAWRLARRQWVAQLRSLLSPLQDPVASLRSYIARVAGTDAAAAAATAAAAAAAPASQQLANGGHSGEGGVPKPVGDALVAAAGQEARSAALKLLQVCLQHQRCQHHFWRLYECRFVRLFVSRCQLHCV